MNTKEFYYWLTGYMSGIYNDGSDVAPFEAFDEIQNKLKEVVIESDIPYKFNIKDFPSSVPNKWPVSPSVGDPDFGKPYIGDPLPGQEPTIICKNDKNEK